MMLRIWLSVLVVSFVGHALPAGAATLSPGDVVISAKTGTGVPSGEWAVLRVDPATGSREVISGYDPVSTTTIGAGPDLEIASCDSQTAFGQDGYIYVIGCPLTEVYFDSVVYRIDPVSGNRSIVSNSNDGGVAATNWNGLSIVPLPASLSVSSLSDIGLPTLVGFLVGASLWRQRTRATTS